MEIIDVAVGLVVNKQGELLISKRQEGQHLEGLWEFPGGKIEKNESVHQALARELFEEVGIEIGMSSPLLDLEYEYPGKTVYLRVRVVKEFSGIATGKEGQEIDWMPVERFDDYPFPPANTEIMSAYRAAIS